MTNDTSILGSPTQHQPPAPAEPSQEDRLLAAASYLGYFTGFWLVVPIVIYVYRREKSRFVAHHALRAVILHVAAIPVFVLSWIFGLALTFGLAYVIETSGWERRDDAGAILGVASMAGWTVPWLMYLAVCAVAAMRAMQGRANPRSLLGRLVERFLQQDKHVAGYKARAGEWEVR